MAIANKNLDELADSELSCLRCDTRLKNAGTGRFAMWDLFRLVGSEGVEALQMLVCPRCGKVEMFV